MFAAGGAFDVTPSARDVLPLTRRTSFCSVTLLALHRVCSAPFYGGRYDMNRPAPKVLRRRFLIALGHAIHVTWPVLSVILAIQLALGLLTGFVEGWSLGDAVYFTFITGLTIGYGDLVPRQALTRIFAIGIGLSGLLLTGVIAAIAVHAIRSALADGASGGERS
jgi:hypothetical protein